MWMLRAMLCFAKVHWAGLAFCFHHASGEGGKNSFLEGQGVLSVCLAVCCNW